MHDLLDQILKLWAAEFGSKELAVKNLLARASKPLLEMFLRVASDPQDRHRIHPRLLGVFLGEHRGIAVAGWKLQDRSSCRQSLWWLEPAPFKKERKFTEEPTEPVKIAESLFDKKTDHAQLSPAEKLGRNLDTALDVNAQIMALGVDADNLKQTRLVGEASGRTLSTAVRVDEAQLRWEDYRLQNLDRLAGLLKEKYDDLGGLLPKPKVVDHDG